MANNMASKMVRLITASSLPAAGLLFTTVYAAEKVHPSELDIYDKPTLVHEVIMEDPPNEFEKKVSGGRKQAMSLWKSMKDVFGRGQSLAQTATVKTSEFMELISTDQTFQIKVAVISSGVLVGAIAAGRGRRPFRRSFYSAGLGTIAFSGCYPQKAWVISQKGFEQSKVLFYKLKTMYDEQQQKRLSQTTEEKPKVNEAEVKEFVEEPPEAKPVVQAEPEPAPEVEIIEEIKDISSSTITTALDSDSDRSYLSYIPFLGWFFSGKSSEDSSALEEVPVAVTTQADSETVKSTSLIEKDSKQAIVGDLGQSNPEDKDMYSTRE